MWPMRGVLWILMRRVIHLFQLIIPTGVVSASVVGGGILADSCYSLSASINLQPLAVAR
jgi:hypothetical protein